MGGSDLLLQSKSSSISNALDVVRENISDIEEGGILSASVDLSEEGEVRHSSLGSFPSKRIFSVDMIIVRKFSGGSLSSPVVNRDSVKDSSSSVFIGAEVISRHLLGDGVDDASLVVMACCLF